MINRYGGAWIDYKTTTLELCLPLSSTNDHSRLQPKPRLRSSKLRCRQAADLIA